MTQPFDYDREVTRAHLDAAGWDLDAFNDVNPFQCHVVYVRDFSSDYVALFSIKMQDFQALDLPETSGELSPLVAHLLKRHQQGRLTGQENMALVPALAGYIKGTRSYQMWREQVGDSTTERLHVVISVYPERGGMLRPFMLREPGTVVPAEVLLQMTEEAREQDLRRHPEWAGAGGA